MEHAEPGVAAYGGVWMESVILAVILLLALALWRFVLTGLQQRPLLRGISAPRQEQGNDNFARPRLPNLGLPRAEIIGGGGWGPGSYRIDLIQAESRAHIYLRRVLVLTGATQTENAYVLDVGTTRFHVRDRYIKRLRDKNNPKGECDETCFYSALQGMPKAEQIAAALLQLSNNPELFDKWAQKDLAFKADGQMFGRV